MLSRPRQGGLQLVDPTGMVELDISQIHSLSSGIFTENMMVIVEGSMRLDSKFHVIAMAMPPVETRESIQLALGGFDTFGGNPTLEFSEIEEEFYEQNKEKQFGFVVAMSNVMLDEQQNMDKFKNLLQSFENKLGERDLPEAFIVIGDFLSKKSRQYGKYTEVEKYYDLKEILQLLVTTFNQYSRLKRSCQLLIVPGENDCCGISKLPQLPFSFDIIEESSKGRIHMCSNPCRFRLCGKEVVVFRQELFNTFLKAALIPPKSQQEGFQAVFEDIVSSQLCQLHLQPLFNRQPPKKRHVWGFEHLMWMYPPPHALILAHAHPTQLKTVVSRCTAFTTGNFSKGQYVECIYKEGSNDNQMQVLHKNTQDDVHVNVQEDLEMLEL
eukprot:TRINITY_DN21374_c0_g1_i4.p1 TRINITY_DN21374_c0_g1~~TRINITY_DN21374_c0_g1_i4.p1  ORF type:complete len:382 (-),score=53.89 TRINITY_DN21374_c0_g1_i4:115-1260(-)